MSEANEIRVPVRPIRFQVSALPGQWFLRYRASVTPDEGTIGFVTDEKTWQAGGIFKDGCWRTLRGKPIDREITAWTVMEAGNAQDR
ncbi:hypothetical protein [Rhizorhabdus sp.]|jgi:hypothetical protein|uniref:hypothetical protein n=1 Tax=Rhizorhabdus sp. TaxID=1968843 RepID=UPI0019B3DA12|nr:hypothetical protein [Rhizorhabdus sp.]MBD3761475.1 hypothetical protein [Rhizorhabdus sp.]